MNKQVKRFDEEENYGMRESKVGTYILYDDYEDLEEANKELLNALEEIREQEKMVSLTFHIADKALAKHEVSDG